jgi:nucleoside 2-deoxyribosyltransferase
MVEETRRCLMAQGIEVFSPYHDIGLGEPKVVAPQDIEAMSNCDLIFALLDGPDAGTLLEVGYGRSIRKRVVAYHTCENKRHLTMLEGSDCAVYDNFVSAIYAAAWEE